MGQGGNDCTSRVLRTLGDHLEGQHSTRKISLQSLHIYIM